MGGGGLGGGWLWRVFVSRGVRKPEMSLAGRWLLESGLREAAAGMPGTIHIYAAFRSGDPPS